MGPLLVNRAGRYVSRETFLSPVRLSRAISAEGRAARLLAQKREMDTLSIDAGSATTGLCGVAGTRSSPPRRRGGGPALAVTIRL
jgi:hypothetical protein